jgi:hypothetical protein
MAGQFGEFSMTRSEDDFLKSDLMKRCGGNVEDADRPAQGSGDPAQPQAQERRAPPMKRSVRDRGIDPDVFSRALEEQKAEERAKRERFGGEPPQIISSDFDD